LFIEPVASKTLNANSLDQVSLSTIYSSHPRTYILIILVSVNNVNTYLTFVKYVNRTAL